MDAKTRRIAQAVALALGSLAILALAVLILAWIVTRIRDEEAMLVAEFGDA